MQVILAGAHAHMILRMLGAWAALQVLLGCIRVMSSLPGHLPYVFGSCPIVAQILPRIW